MLTTQTAPFPRDLLSAQPFTGGNEEHLLGIFLNRLRRLMQHRAQHASALNPDGIRLLDHAIFSTYCDCRRLGGQAVAQGLVQTGLRPALPERTLTGIA